MRMFAAAITNLVGMLVGAILFEKGAEKIADEINS